MCRYHSAMHAPADDGLDLRVAFVVVVDERRG
jgi:hypothetical protein